VAIVSLRSKMAAGVPDLPTPTEPTRSTDPTQLAGRTEKGEPGEMRFTSSQVDSFYFVLLFLPSACMPISEPFCLYVCWIGSKFA